MQKILLLLLTLITPLMAQAGDYYFYMENPDPSKYIIVWDGSPDPNCHEFGPNGYETYGWIYHENGRTVEAAIALKDNPLFAAREYSSHKGEAGNTEWITLPGYIYYQTWACG